VEVNGFFFPRYMKRWKEEGGKGYIFFWKCFFHCGVAREGFTGGYYFLQIHYGGRGRLKVATHGFRSVAIWMS
jgi:hypothetical protein